MVETETTRHFFCPNLEGDEDDLKFFSFLSGSGVGVASSFGGDLVRTVDWRLSCVGEIDNECFGEWLFGES